MHLYLLKQKQHMFKSALNSTKFDNKMLLSKVSVNIPLISTTESSNPLAKTD